MLLGFKDTVDNLTKHKPDKLTELQNLSDSQSVSDAGSGLNPSPKKKIDEAFDEKVRQLDWIFGKNGCAYQEGSSQRALSDYDNVIEYIHPHINKFHIQDDIGEEDLKKALELLENVAKGMLGYLTIEYPKNMQDESNKALQNLYEEKLHKAEFEFPNVTHLTIRNSKALNILAVKLQKLTQLDAPKDVILNNLELMKQLKIVTISWGNETSEQEDVDAIKNAILSKERMALKVAEIKLLETDFTVERLEFKEVQNELNKQTENSDKYDFLWLVDDIKIDARTCNEDTQELVALKRNSWTTLQHIEIVSSYADYFEHTLSSPYYIGQINTDVESLRKKQKLEPQDMRFTGKFESGDTEKKDKFIDINFRHEGKFISITTNDVKSVRKYADIYMKYVQHLELQLTETLLENEEKELLESLKKLKNLTQVVLRTSNNKSFINQAVERLLILEKCQVTVSTEHFELYYESNFRATQELPIIEAIQFDIKAKWDDDLTVPTDFFAKWIFKLNLENMHISGNVSKFLYRITRNEDQSLYANINVKEITFDVGIVSTMDSINFEAVNVFPNLAQLRIVINQEARPLEKDFDAILKCLNSNVEVSHEFQWRLSDGKQLPNEPFDNCYYFLRSIEIKENKENNENNEKKNSLRESMLTLFKDLLNKFASKRRVMK